MSESTEGGNRNLDEDVIAAWLRQGDGIVNITINRSDWDRLFISFIQQTTFNKQMVNALATLANENPDIASEDFLHQTVDLYAKADQLTTTLNTFIEAVMKKAKVINRG